MIQSVTLSAAESLLLKIEEQRHKEVLKDSTDQLTAAVQAIYAAHGWVWGVTKGQMQRDPLDQTTVRFVYDDGVAAPLPDVPAESVPELKIVPLTA